MVGGQLAQQKDKTKDVRNDRIVAIAEASVLYSEVKQLGDLSPFLLKQIDDFFVNYQRVRDIEVTPLGHDGPEHAKQLLEKAWDEHANPFTGVVRFVIMMVRRKLGDPPVIETVPGAGYRIP